MIIANRIRLHTQVERVSVSEDRFCFRIASEVLVKLIDIPRVIVALSWMGRLSRMTPSVLRIRIVKRLTTSAGLRNAA